MPEAKTIAILGAGKLGTVLARLATKAGYTVYITGSGDASKIALSIQYIAPGAIATTNEQAIDKSDVIILALPLGKYRTLPKDSFKGKLVIDAMNYWWEVDGDDPEIASPNTSSSEAVQEFLRGAHVSKALSHMGYHHLFDEARPKEDPLRKAIAIAGDHDADNQTISGIIDDLGFDPIVIGPLKNGKILEPGHRLFGANVGKDELLSTAKSELQLT